MSTSNLIEMISVIATLLGGGGVGVAKLTRIAIAAESLAEKIAVIAGQVAEQAKTVQDHENRLNKGGL